MQAAQLSLGAHESLRAFVPQLLPQAPWRHAGVHCSALHLRAMQARALAGPCAIQLPLLLTMHLHYLRHPTAAGGEWATAEERERLAARLASLPTSEADDQALLDSGKVTGEEQGRASSVALP